MAIAIKVGPYMNLWRLQWRNLIANDITVLMEKSAMLPHLNIGAFKMGISEIINI